MAVGKPPLLDWHERIRIDRRSSAYARLRRDRQTAATGGSMLAAAITIRLRARARSKARWIGRSAGDVKSQSAVRRSLPLDKRAEQKQRWRFGEPPLPYRLHVHW